MNPDNFSAVAISHGSFRQSAQPGSQTLRAFLDITSWIYENDRFGIFSGVGNPFATAFCRTKKRLVSFFVVRGSIDSTISLISGLSTEVRKKLAASLSLSFSSPYPGSPGPKWPNIQTKGCVLLVFDVEESCASCGRMLLPHNATKWSSSTATTETRFLKDGLLAIQKRECGLDSICWAKLVLTGFC